MEVNKIALRGLALEVNDELTKYIRVHDMIIKESASFSSFVKNLFGKGRSMSELREESEKVFDKWNNLYLKVKSRIKLENEFTSDEKIYFKALLNYVLLVLKTVEALLERQRIVEKQSLGSKNADWKSFEEANNYYESMVDKYQKAGDQLNRLNYLVF